MPQLTTQIKIEEEQSNDSEIGHTTEVVGHLAFGSKTATTKQPTTPTSVDKKSLFTWGYGDTQNISGFTFYINDNLLCKTTNRDDRQIIPHADLLNETKVFTMPAVILDGSESNPANILTSALLITLVYLEYASPTYPGSLILV